MVELTIAIPTLDERDNIAPLLAALDSALAGIAWEVIFVDDDSQDGTPELIRTVAQDRPNVRLLQRIRRRGLASACTEGMLASHAPFVAVMDADLQHDATLLPRMLARLRAEPLDIVVGSRHVAGGEVGDFPAGRRWLSTLGSRLARLLLRIDLRDPMSGFFMLRTEFLHETVHFMSNTGFKILLDLLLSAPRPVRFAELPYRFGRRASGVSKLDLLVTLEYLQLLTDKTLGRIVPLRFLGFVLVGGLGVLVNLAVLALLYRGLGIPFGGAQPVATLAAMVGNFVLNNRLTYRDRRLHGAALWRGLGSFCLACSIGAIMSLLVANLLFNGGAPWGLAGLGGAFAGSIWNYATTATFIWGQTKPRRPAASPAKLGY